MGEPQTPNQNVVLYLSDSWGWGQMEVSSALFLGLIALEWFPLGTSSKHVKCFFKNRCLATPLLHSSGSGGGQVKL